MILLLLLSFLAQGGELGFRLEGPAPASTLWLAETWDWEAGNLAVYAEGTPFPPTFRRANLKLTWNLDQLTISPELFLLGSGRVDLFFTGSAKGSASFLGMNTTFHAGMKGGWVGVNIAPSPIFVAWSAIRLEKDKLSAELNLDGPSPWRPSLAFSLGSVAINFGSTIFLTVSHEEGMRTGSSGLQIFPSPTQFHTLRWNWEKADFQIFLASSGQIWAKAMVSEGNLASSAFFSRSPGGNFQAVLEVRLSF